MKKISFRNLKETFIVAEISANHGQNFKMAIELIKKAKECGADAVKFQCYTPDTLTIDCNNKYFQIKHHKWGEQTLYQLYKKAYTPWKWFKELKKVADDIGIIFFATSFDKSSVDFLESIDIPIHKISSFELNDLPLIEYVAKTKKPIVLSCGMATLEEIKEAINTVKRQGVKDIILLKCNSSYPANPKEMNLRTIPDMIKKFKLPIGLSDHTLEIVTSIVAVSLGAKMVEKHFISSRKIKTPDNFFSLEPAEFKVLVNSIRIAEQAIGDIHYGFTSSEKESRKYRRSLFAVKDIKKGEIFTEENIKSIRPSFGIATKYIKKILGKKAKKNIKRGTPLKWNLID